YVTCIFFSSRRRHTRFSRDWSSDVCSSDLKSADMSLAGSVSEREVNIAAYVASICARFLISASWARAACACQSGVLPTTRPALVAILCIRSSTLSSGLISMKVSGTLNQSGMLSPSVFNDVAIAMACLPVRYSGQQGCAPSPGVVNRPGFAAGYFVDGGCLNDACRGTFVHLCGGVGGLGRH